jgi:hypothetical protein
MAFRRLHWTVEVELEFETLLHWPPQAETLSCRSSKAMRNSTGQPAVSAAPTRSRIRAGAANSARES